MAADICSPSLRVSVRSYRRLRLERGLKAKPYVGSLEPSDRMGETEIRTRMENGGTLLAFRFVTTKRHDHVTHVELAIDETPTAIDIAGQVVPVEEQDVLLSAVSLGVINRFAVLNACPGQISLVVCKLTWNYESTNDLTFVPSATRLVNFEDEKFSFGLGA